MANRNAPNGFLPFTCSHHGAGQPVARGHVLLATNAEIGIGDPVSVQAGGLDLWTTGAVMGFSAEYVAANSGGNIKVWDDPQQLFVAQTDDGTGTATASGVEGLNATMVTSTVVNRRSVAEIDESSAATTANLPLKIVKLSPEAGNAFGEFNRLVVKINNHQLQGGTGTAGV